MLAAGRVAIHVVHRCMRSRIGVIMCINSLTQLCKTSRVQLYARKALQLSAVNDVSILTSLN